MIPIPRQMAATNWEFLTVAVSFLSFFHSCDFFAVAFCWSPEEIDPAFLLQNRTYTHMPTYQPLICECECVYAIDASSAWFFIANCYSFVFASSTLYRIIMLRLVLRFSFVGFSQRVASRPLCLSLLLIENVCVCVGCISIRMFFLCFFVDWSRQIRCSIAIQAQCTLFFDAINTHMYTLDLDSNSNSISFYI